MPCTKYSIAEQVLLKIYGGYPKPNDPIQFPDVMLAVGQVCNTMLKAQHFTYMGQGENYPENLMIAEYPPVTLKSYGTTKSIAILPAMPVGLIRNIGVWMVSTDENFECLLIPMMSGQDDLLRGQSMISNLLGQTGYTPNGMKIITTNDLTAPPFNNKSLYFRLLVTDVTILSDYDILPIPADYESLVIQSLMQQFAPVQSQERIVDNYSGSQKTTQSQ